MWQLQILRNKQFNNHNKQDKIIKIKCSFYVLVCVCRKYSDGQLNKNMICSSMSACVHVGKVYRINVSIVEQSKKDKKLTLLTYMYMRVCKYLKNRKYGPFVFLSPHVRFFYDFGDNMSRFGSRQKNVACFFALCPVCDAFCCQSLPLVVECGS